MIGGWHTKRRWAHAHRFTVLLRPSECPDEATRRALALVVEAEKPAHTAFDFRIVEGEAPPAAGTPPAAEETGPSRIGVDSVLGDGGLRL